MIRWKEVIILEEDENDPWCWSAEINHKKYGKYVWITMHDKDKFHVDVKYVGATEIETLVVCRTLTSAKRWVSRYLCK